MINFIGGIAVGICIGAAAGMTIQLLTDLRCIKDIQNIYETEIKRIKTDFKHREQMRIVRSNSEQMQIHVPASDWIDVEPLPISREWKEIDFSGRF